MVTLCTAQDVLDRCGVNANSTVVASTAIIERYIEVSEATICAETRRDWINDYANVPAEVQATLKSCTASHAAKQIIMYDMSGFSTRAEAITMLNVNQDEFVRTKKALEDQDIIKIREVPA